ncbi:KAP family NTPase [Azospirillum sp. A1-3]|uniref:KAP family P-loop NTPase fold protein n=1 Tax=Azospirillum sp. A1-3 TaxID=185874 RepID=UPI00207736FC|nr:P-loop NTPase fold protein [Azospirillum sp. A1-3]MCM8738381.1 KAP family NTPase [Azospirillum sp. A1-3]
MIEIIWEDDQLNRRQDAEFLQKFLIGRIKERENRGLHRSYVLNLDAGWGRGKTFFILRLAKQLRYFGYVVVEVDAWKDDHADDPMLPVISAIDTEISKFVQIEGEKTNRWEGVVRKGSYIALSVAKGAGMHWLRKFIGEGADELKNLVTDINLSETAKAAAKPVEDAIESSANEFLQVFRSRRSVIEEFKSSFSLFMKDNDCFTAKLPLFIVIDELDRCRPTFSISMLERIKHIFDVDGCVFIVSTNTDQLQKSIKAVYGDSFDSESYLSRFFDRTYRFKEPIIENFVKSLVTQYGVDANRFRIPPGYTLDNYISSGLVFYGLGLRDAAQCIDIIRSFVTIWDEDLKIELSVLLPLAISGQQGKLATPLPKVPDILTEIRNKNGSHTSEWTINFYNEKSNGDSLFRSFLGFLGKAPSESLNTNYARTHQNEWIREYLINEHNYLVQRRGRQEVKVARAWYYWDRIRNIGNVT